jgi:type IV pilus assembly protein PilV
MINQHQTMTRASHTHGFTLLEVMVAMLIFSIGLLGLAGLHVAGLSNNKTADLRGLAVIMTYDMAERIRANNNGASGNYDAVSTAAAAAPGSNCVTSTSCNTSASIALWDIFEWKSTLATAMPSGTGTITRANTSSPFVITVMWDEARTGVNGTACSGDPSVDLKCYRMEFLP